VSIHRELQFHELADPSDPDDWRPNSRMAFAGDPDTDMVVIAERLAPGDAIPLHRHRIDEVVVYLSGIGILRMGDDEHAVRGGDIVLIPAGTRHGMRNTGDEAVEFRAAFPSVRIDVEYFERNPAPGTEADAPQPPFVLDTRTGQVEPLTG
jgi:quercetin dioxygenase-like cupin family protein